MKRETLLLIAGTFGRPAYQLKPIENDKFRRKSVCLLEWWMLIAQRSDCKSHFWKASTVPFVRLNTSVTGSWPRAGIFSNAICKLLRLPHTRFVYWLPFTDFCDCQVEDFYWLAGTRLRKSWGLGSQRITPTYLESKAHLGNSILIERIKTCISLSSNETSQSICAQEKCWGIQKNHCNIKDSGLDI